jgi:hypothetical protein
MDGMKTIHFLLLFPLLALAQTPVLESKIHDKARPHPPIVEPKPIADLKTQAPAGAKIVFDGKNLDGFKDCKWTLKDGWFQVDKIGGKGPGDIQSTDAFGDGHFHLEWAVGETGAGNSGIYIHGLYEVQVFNTYQNATGIYADGQAGAIYGQYPPQVNACRPQGEWEVFDIDFTGPRFREDGNLIAPARMTVHHNGHLIHNDVPLTGPTSHHARPAYKKMPAKASFTLQDHGSPVMYRNIWVLEK